MTLRTTLALLSSTLVAGSASAALSVFNLDGDFASTGPAQMGLYKGNAFGTFGTDTVGGMLTGVYNFPAATASQGLEITHNAAPNGGGAYVNQYTLGYDIKWTNAGPWAAFLQTNTGNSNDGDLFRNGDGGIGISGIYDGTTLSDTWYRVVFTFDLGPKELKKYINGSLAATQTLDSGLDGRWSLDPTFEILTDNDGDTNTGSLATFFFEDRTWTPDEVAVYGGANVPEPSSLALLAFGVVPFLRRRKV